MPLTRVTFRQLEAFVVVAELRSFSAAGQRLGLTTQAISQLVAELEATLAFKLFDRTTRRVDLTGAGLDYLASATTVLRHLQAAEKAADDLRNRAAGLVRVGAPLVLASTALPEAIATYTKRHPKVVVRIKDLPVDRLVGGVSAGDVDLAIGPDRVTGSEVAAEALFDSPWVLWCAPNHALAKLRTVRWADLGQQPLVVAGHDHERGVARMQITAPEDERITPVDVVDNISTALGLAAHGVAATLAPAYVQAIATHYGLVMRRVVDPETVRKVCLYRPTGRTLSPAAAGFADFLSDWLKRWPQGTRRRRP